MTDQRSIIKETKTGIPMDLGEDTTFSQLDEVLSYVVQDILHIPDTSVVYHQDEIVKILDLITMTQSEIEAITGT